MLNPFSDFPFLTITDALNLEPSESSISFIPSLFHDNIVHCILTLLSKVAHLFFTSHLYCKNSTVGSPLFHNWMTPIVSQMMVSASSLFLSYSFCTVQPDLSSYIPIFIYQNLPVAIHCSRIKILSGIQMSASLYHCSSNITFYYHWCECSTPFRPISTFSFSPLL